MGDGEGRGEEIFEAAERPVSMARADAPVRAFIRAAFANGVSQDAAWALWRSVFTKSTRSIFRAVWADEVRANV